ncbi:hypothetical protein HNQ35_000579 [Cerasibacillus quisquiliarum]|uniref:Uncharacterized protein n=1 Tax=Cerasibacillus quisquiliarum TaxID=227865 RepID=A0A511V245_9BACI|nr:hypothetical protein [Cerasibacillus quisquiliarum]MBB5145387.1 hypothetical protein [Cerasibacillus quisquiliarum]GEN31823.1 hypothetical protein CQU01_20610 [Cerasibacillus quisquiliarum]
MSSGLMFYWLSWMFFVYVLFFMKYDKHQWFLMYWILIIMSTSNMYMTLTVLKFSIAYIVLFIGSIMFLLQTNHRLFHFFSSFTLAIAYASFLVWEHETPLLLFFPKYLVLPSFIVLIAIFLMNEFKNRCFVSLVGACGGELLYHISLMAYTDDYTMGHDIFFDLCAIIITFLTVIALYERMIDKLLMFFTRILQRP